MPNNLSSGYSKYSQRLIASLLAAVIALQSGVSQALEPVKADAPVTQSQAALGNVALTVTAKLPELEFVRGASGSGGTAFRDCIAGAGCGSGGPAGCAAGMLVGLVVCGLVVAPVAAYSAESKAEAATAADATVAPTLDTAIVQDALRNEIMAAAQGGGIKLATVQPEITQTTEGKPDYRQLAATGVDTVLEVTLIQMFSERYAYQSSTRSADRRAVPNPILPLEMMAAVRLVKTSDNSEIFFELYEYHGKQYKYAEWSSNNAERLVSAMKTGYESLGHDISDRIFLLYPFADRQGTGESGNCGLAALGPKDDRAEDLMPLLSWQSFPRASDIAVAPDDMARVKNVSYDLILSSGGNGESPEVFYRREGLTSPTHKIEMTLNPNTRYFWSVRARFNLDGRQRVTEWATSCPFEQQLIVGASLYRFYTPKI